MKNKQLLLIFMSFINFGLTKLIAQKTPIYPPTDIEIAEKVSKYGLKIITSQKEIAEIALKYGVIYDPAKQNGLVFCDKKVINDYYRDEALVIESDKQFKKFLKEEPKIVTTRTEFYELLNKYPLVKKSYIRASRLSEKDWELQAQKEKKMKYRVYRSKENFLYFVIDTLPIDQDELNFGKRVDKIKNSITNKKKLHPH